MIVGLLDRKIEIYTYSSSRDAAGQPIKVRSLFNTIYANIDYSPSSESILAAKITTETKIKLTIRYLSGLEEKMQVKFDDQYYEIISIQPQGRRESMTLIVTKYD